MASSPENLLPQIVKHEFSQLVDPYRNMHRLPERRLRTLADFKNVMEQREKKRQEVIENL